MLVGFKRQFAPFVLDGSKRHTIRAERKDRKVPSIGETLHLYADPRQKAMELLGRWPCTKVESITILRHFNPSVPILVSIAGVLLADDEAADFLWRDGFREWMNQPIPAGHLISLTAANYFWLKRLKKAGGRWDGHLIHWGFETPAPKKKGDNRGF